MAYDDDDDGGWYPTQPSAGQMIANALVSTAVAMVAGKVAKVAWKVVKRGALSMWREGVDERVREVVEGSFGELRDTLVAQVKEAVEKAADDEPKAGGKAKR